MMNGTPSIQYMKILGTELAHAVSDLLSYGTSCPDWHTKQAAWRHNPATHDALLFVLLKLAGSVSAANAMIVLAEKGFWVESAILSRSIYDANLAIAFILPASESDWPSAKQKEALDAFFKETWEDPKHPFEEPTQRSQIRIKDLKEGLAKFQDANTEMNPHDSGQAALQMMRFLSDYTHMAYPRLMELLEAGHGYRLNGEQPKSSAFGASGVAGTLNYCASTAHTVSILISKVATVEYAKNQGKPSALERLVKNSAVITEISNRLALLSAWVESATIPAGASARKVLRDFKSRQKDPKDSNADSKPAPDIGSSTHQG